MKNVDWDDLQVFLHVAREGGLSGAARHLDISVPTIGRRMLSLEQATGQTLFERDQTGYRLTRAGDALYAKVRAMEAAARPVQDFLRAAGERPVVRLSAGTGTAMFLADRFADLWRPGDDFRIAFVTTEAVLDIAHREIDIGIRNRPAEAGNLASRRLQKLRFAPFRNRNVAEPDLLEWVAMEAGSARHPAARWLVDQPDLPVCAWANSVATVHELVRAGVGIGLMPCMVGDRDPILTRAGPVIDELTETQWLVAHDDDRHLPHIRKVIDRLVNLYQDSAPLLAGERPLNG